MVKFSKKNPMWFLTYFSVNEVAFNWVASGGIVFYLLPDGFKFSGLGFAVGHSVSGSLKPSIVKSLIKSQTEEKKVILVEKQYNDIRGKLEAALYTLLVNANLSPGFTPFGVAEDPSPEEKEAKKLFGGSPTSGPKEPVNFEPVPLANAQTLHELVKGTSTSSVYITVGVSPDLKVAARVKDGNISIRAEGDIGKYKESLQSVGMAVQDSHASLHLATSSAATPNKIIGAVLFSLPVTFQTSYPDLALIKKYSN
jgi:hypothetical protein